MSLLDHIAHTDKVPMNFSAGAIGVLLNVDRVSSKLRSLGFKVNVRGLVDSGWYLDNITRKPGCTQGSCPAKTIEEGMRSVFITLRCLYFIDRKTTWFQNFPEAFAR